MSEAQDAYVEAKAALVTLRSELELVSMLILDAGEAAYPGITDRFSDLQKKELALESQAIRAATLADRI